MEFIKYPSIENATSINIENYKSYLLFNGIMDTQAYIVEEKIDGANFGLYISEKEVKFAKRTGFIDGFFFNLHHALPEIQPVIDVFKEKIENCDYIDNFILYGELFGPGIQNRVDYGDKVMIRFYDICEFADGYHKNYTKRYIEELTKETGIDRFFIPKVDRLFSNIDEALQYCIDNVEDTKTIFAPEKTKMNTNIEGFVISEYLGEKRFKVKSKAFFERSIKPYAKYENNCMNRTGIDLKALRTEFLTYLNKNRMLSVISKEGYPTSVKDATRYIKLLLEDAKIDFLKDHTDLQELTVKEFKYIWNAGRVPYEIFSEFIQK